MAADRDANAGELTDEVVDSFLPWSDRVPESCKLDPAAAEKAKEMPDDFIIESTPMCSMTRWPATPKRACSDIAA